MMMASLIFNEFVPIPDSIASVLNSIDFLSVAVQWTDTMMMVGGKIRGGAEGDCDPTIMVGGLFLRLNRFYNYFSVR